MRKLLPSYGCLFLLLVGCGQQVKQEVPLIPKTARPADFPVQFYLNAKLTEGQAFTIDSKRSLAKVRVYRGGRFASMGHNHIVSSKDIKGYLFVANDFAKSRADLFFPVSRLIIDDDQLRKTIGKGFEKPIPQSAKDGTRNNMLGDKLLDGNRYPFIKLAVVGFKGTRDKARLITDITIQKMTKRMILSAIIKEQNGEMTIIGRFSIKQTDFGLTPFSVLGGALKVLDKLDIQYQLVARN